VLIWPPRFDNIAMRATAMSAVMMPYSTAVAAPSSPRKFLHSARMFIAFCSRLGQPGRPVPPVHCASWAKTSKLTLTAAKKAAASGVAGRHGERNASSGAHRRLQRVPSATIEVTPDLRLVRTRRCGHADVAGEACVQERKPSRTAPSRRRTATPAARIALQGSLLYINISLCCYVIERKQREWP